MNDNVLKYAPLAFGLSIIIIAFAYVTRPQMPFPERTYGTPLEGFYKYSSDMDCFENNPYRRIYDGKFLAYNSQKKITFSLEIRNIEIRPPFAMYDSIFHDGSQAHFGFIDDGNELTLASHAITNTKGKVFAEVEELGHVGLISCSEVTFWGEILLTLRLAKPLKIPESTLETSYTQ